MQGLLERHFDVDERFALPPLDSILNHGELRHDTIDVTHVYYDTPDHDLQAQGVALCRRDGHGETGWRTVSPTGLLYARERQIARHCRQKAKVLR